MNRTILVLRLGLKQVDVLESRSDALEFVHAIPIRRRHHSFEYMLRQLKPLVQVRPTASVFVATPESTGLEDLLAIDDVFCPVMDALAALGTQLPELDIETLIVDRPLGTVSDLFAYTTKCIAQEAAIAA